MVSASRTFVGSLLFAIGCGPIGGVSGVLNVAAPDAGTVAEVEDAGFEDAVIYPDVTIEEDAGLEPPDTGPPDTGPMEPPDAGRPPGVPTASGPSSGVVMVHGGGGTISGRTGLFFDLVGNASAPVVVVPTAQSNVSIGGARSSLTNVGFSNVSVVHTRNPAEADTEVFVAPMQQAAGVWISGGRQWRLADAYLGTRFMVELQGVLDRGGVVGGTSAGASIMGSFLIRGDTSGNAILIGDHVEGFGFLQNVGVDQHVAERGRETDLFEFVDQYPDQLGIGLDEPVAAVFRGNRMEIFGQGRAYVHYRALWDDASSEDDRYLRLQPGTIYDIFELQTR